MTARTPASPGSERSWWTQRWFVASASLIVVLVLLSAYLAVSGDQSGDGRSAGAPAVAGSPAAAGSAPPAASAVNPQGCALSAGDQSVPASAPDASWELVGSMAAPAEPASIGPQRTVGGLRVCFAHSPVGALFAAVSFWAEGTAHPYTEVYRRLAADTPAKAAAINDARNNVGERLDSATKVQVAGFAITSYDGVNAALTLVFRVANGGLYAVPSTMRWEDGDWRFVVAATGGVPGAGQIPDLTGYVAWSGA
ncbi:MAG: hypothetical protein ACR2LV_05455 [Solirubrobacteraceae bacterium]